MSLLDAGFDRWRVFDPYSLPVVNLVCFTPLLLLMIAYDWWSTGKVQRVTIWSTIFMVVVQQIRHPLGHTAAWQSFAAWVAVHMPSFSCRFSRGTGHTKFTSEARPPVCLPQVGDARCHLRKSKSPGLQNGRTGHPAVWHESTRMALLIVFELYYRRDGIPWSNRTLGYPSNTLPCPTANAR